MQYSNQIFSHIILGTDKNWFKKMSNAGKDQTNPINVDQVKAIVSGSGGILSPQAAEFAINAQRSLDRQKEMLTAFNENMDKKHPANVSPGDQERKKKLKDFLDAEPNNGRRKTTTVTTKTITDADGHVTTVKTTEEVSCPTVTASALR